MLNILWVIMMAGGIFFATCQGTIGEITQQMIDSSSEAVNLCIFMLGVIGMWNGLMEIGLESGLMEKIEGCLHPFIHWLFPDIPKKHKANQYIAINMAANILGLGWAATPAGLKAMKELKKLEAGRSYGKNSGESGRASDTMCAFLVLNISSLQLIPINMIAFRAQYGSVNPQAVVLPAICATAISTLAGILFIKCMEIFRRKNYHFPKEQNTIWKENYIKKGKKKWRRSK